MYSLCGRRILLVKSSSSWIFHYFLVYLLHTNIYTLVATYNHQLLFTSAKWKLKKAHFAHCIKVSNIISKGSRCMMYEYCACSYLFPLYKFCVFCFILIALACFFSSFKLRSDKFRWLMICDWKTGFLNVIWWDP